MDPNRINVAGLPTFALILVILLAIVYALKRFNQKFPEVSETVKDKTPWLGWTEEVKPSYAPKTITRPSNRW